MNPEGEMGKYTLHSITRWSTRSMIFLLLILMGALVAVQTTYSDSSFPMTKNGDLMTIFAGTDQITNPVVPQRADPWVYKHTDGYYYFTASVPEYDRIEIRRATTIAGLSSATPVTVWKKHDTGIMSKHIWAPEIHSIDGKWYIYFAAANVVNPFDHRVYVLETEAANPLEGTWVEKGQIKMGWESFSPGCDDV